MDTIYLNFSNAFDSVAHKRWLDKMESYGCTRKILGWCTSFLSDRRQSRLHLRTDNPQHEYRMSGTSPEDAREERRLGVIVDEKLKLDVHTETQQTKRTKLSASYAELLIT